MHNRLAIRIAALFLASPALVITALFMASPALVITALFMASPALAQAPGPALDLRARTQNVADADVIERLEAGERPAVVVYLAEPRGGSRRTAALVAATLSQQELGSRREFSEIPVLAGSVNAAGLVRLAEDSRVVRVSLDHPIQAQVNQVRPLVGVDALHTAGVTGNGVVGVIIDTGIDLDHPDLADAITDEVCYCLGAAGPTGCCPNGLDEQTGPGAGQDQHGHGTRVGGIVTSAAVHAGLGIAPAAELIAVRVLDAAGGGSASDLISGLNWVLANHLDADVVNLSLGGGLYVGDCDNADAVTLAYSNAIGQLRDAGILTIAGSGNNQSGVGMIAPACVADAISVGAVWDADVGSQTVHGCMDATTAADQVTCWSNSSTTTDVFAPGAPVLSSKLDGTTQSGSGTSYAAPVVSGCVLLFRSAFPELTAIRLERAIEDSAIWVTDTTNGLSFPRVNCNEAFGSLSPRVPALHQPHSGSLGLVILVAGLAASAWWRLSRRVGRPPTTR